MAGNSKRLESLQAAVLGVAILTPTASALQPPVAALGCSTEYVIGPEDVLDIAVWNNADISRTVPVRPDGRISLPLLHDVQAAGLTPMQLRDNLAAALAKYVTTPGVSVIVQQVHSVKVTVLGEVKTPGRYELKSRSTVLDVLAMAGGMTDYAERARIVVLREQGGATRQIPFSVDKATAKRRPGEAGSAEIGAINFCLIPGDIVLVP
jgi:polysaccharide export outer membrane protein